MINKLKKFEKLHFNRPEVITLFSLVAVIVYTIYMWVKS